MAHPIVNEWPTAEKSVEVILRNFRKCRIYNTGQRFVDGEYPSGGYIIHVWNYRSETWFFICHCETQFDVDTTLRLIERNDRAVNFSNEAATSANPPDVPVNDK